MIVSLKEAGAKMTAQRIAICEWLSDNPHHPTAAEVHEALSSRFPTMSLATVYNTLGLLAEMDLIHEVGTAPDGSTRYDSNTSPHVNLLCKQCGTIIDVTDVDLSLFERLAPAHNFAMDDVQVVIHGLCADCRAETSEAK